MAPDWRLLFSFRQAAGSPSASAEYGLWTVPLRAPTGEGTGKPERLAYWSDFRPDDLTVTADGKRLSFLKVRGWYAVYLGELGPDGAGMKPPRRFTLDDRVSLPEEWTRDSLGILFSSMRNGKFEIFRQGLNDSAAEAVVQGRGQVGHARVSPDGSWMLYRERTGALFGAPPSPRRLMRRPIARGSPEMVLEEPAGVDWDYRCPPKPGFECVLSQQEGKDTVFYALDPVRGKGDRVGMIEAGNDPTWEWSVSWSLSPDGSRVALVSVGKNKG